VSDGEGEAEVEPETEVEPWSEAEERAAGWYPDPFGRLRFRWWDGEKWSAYAGSSSSDVQWDPDPVESVEPLPPGLPALGTAIAGYAIGLGLSFVLQLVHWAVGEPGGEPSGLIFGQSGLWAGLIGACVVVSRRRGTRSLIRDFAFRFRPIDLAFGLVGLVAGRIAAAIAISPIIFLLDEIEQPESGVFDNVTGAPGGWLVIVGIVAIGAPLVEELFFRGLLQPRLVGRWGLGWGIAVTSVLFGAAHLTGWQGPITLVYALSIVGVGAVFGMLRHYTDRLGPSIVAHAMLNAQALILLALLD
jgi:membrane protease YdiL (CAAX protease family)